MANSLNQDLTGKWVVMLAKALKPEYSALHDRLYRCEGGFGCLSYTSGTFIGGTYMLDGHAGEDAARGFNIERLATDEEVAIGYAEMLRRKVGTTD